VSSFSAGGSSASTINAMAIAPDGRGLLTGHDDASAALWTLEGVLVRRFEAPQPLVTSSQRVVQVAFDPAGTALAVGHENGTVRRWSTSGNLLSEIETGIENLKALAITANGDAVAAGWHGARRWDVRGRQQRSLREEGIVESLQMLPDGSAAVLAGTQVDGYLEIRDLQGRTLLNLQPPSASPEGPLAVSPDGRVLVMADTNRLHRWMLPAAFR
jgi:WD40 repeat protein